MSMYAMRIMAKNIIPASLQSSKKYKAGGFARIHEGNSRIQQKLDIANKGH